MALIYSASFTAADGTTFNNTALPSIDKKGRVWYQASLNTPDHTFNNPHHALFNSRGPGSVLQIAREGEPAAGTDVLFDRLHGLTVGDSGQSVFYGGLRGQSLSSADDNGIWSTNLDGSLRLVARAGDIVPGLAGDARFGILASRNDFNSATTPRYAINAGGQIAFGAPLVGTADANDRAIFVSGAGEMRMVARRGMTAPGADGGVFATFLPSGGVPSINDHGEVAFAAGVDGTLNFEGVWSEGGGGDLTAVALRGDPAPGIGGGTTLASFLNPRINNRGEVAFLAFLDGSGIDRFNNTGIFTGRPGQLSLVAREGAPAPGVAGDTVFDSLDPFDVNQTPIINKEGRVAFFGRLAGPSIDASNNGGIWGQDRNGVLSLIAREGAEAPGGGVFSHLEPYRWGLQMNAAGQLAFLGSVRLNDQSFEAGIWAQDRAGELRLIVRTDQSVPFYSRINSLGFGDSSGGEDGWAASFNDRGELVFRANAGIFVSTLVAVPEPPAVSLLAAILALGFILGRRLL
jgi:hypothetical protein